MGWSSWVEAGLVLGAFLILSRLGRDQWQSRRWAHLNEALLQQLPVQRGQSYFRVHLASPAHFARKLRRCPWDAQGFLVLTHSGARLVGQSLDGARFDLDYPDTALDVAWVGCPPWAPSGNLYWFRLGREAAAWYVSANVGPLGQSSDTATVDLFRRVSPGQALPEGAGSLFPLESHPATRWSLVVLPLLTLGLALDAVLWNPYTLVAGWDDRWGWAAACVLGLGLYWGLSHRRVPRRSSCGLAVLMGVVMGLGHAVIVKRLDQWLAPPSQVYVYTLAPGATLIPPQPGLPELRFAELAAYWAQFPVGSQHEFRLLHGPVGLWQMDGTELNARLLVFYLRRGGLPKRISSPSATWGG